jgi:hypothetical protein
MKRIAADELVKRMNLNTRAALAEAALESLPIDVRRGVLDSAVALAARPLSEDADRIARAIERAPAEQRVELATTLVKRMCAVAGLDLAKEST